MLRISILIPVRNRKSMTHGILQQLSQQMSAVSLGNTFINIVVVDDGSTDGTVEMIQQQFPQVILLRGNGHLWWTGAICHGMEYILEQFNSDYILWLNDDIILNPNFIQKIIETCQIPGNEQHITGGIVQSSSHPDWIVFGGFIEGQQVCNLNDFSQKNLIEVDAINGNIAMIHQKIIETIGLPNLKKYKHYGGDYEFGIRAKEAGFKVMLSSQLQALTDYTIEDFIRYMPPLLQWYLKPAWKDRIKIFKGLTALKAHYNIWHLVNMIYFEQENIPLKKYLGYYYREVRKLLLCDFKLREKCQQDLKQYIQNRQAPREIAEVVLGMRR